MTADSDYLRDAVRAVNKLRTQKNIARRAGVRHETPNRFVKGKQKMSARSIAAVRRALDDIDRETAEAFSAVPRSAVSSGLIERINKRLPKETEPLQRMLCKESTKCQLERR